MRSVVIPIATAAALAFAVQAAVAKPYEIPTGSMEPTIATGDRIIANRLIYRARPIQRADVIVFATTEQMRTSCNAPSNTPFVKRVIGLPGDRVEIVDGRTLVNGRPLPISAATIPEYAFGPVVVPAERLFVLGDNRNRSCDSHSWSDPFVPRASVIGQAEIAYWPPRSMGFLD